MPTSALYQRQNTSNHDAAPGPTHRAINMINPRMNIIYRLLHTLKKQHTMSYCMKKTQYRCEKCRIRTVHSLGDGIYIFK